MSTAAKLALLAALVSSAVALQCYVCNSGDDKDCLTNYQQFEKKCYLRTFAEYKSVRAVGCRTINEFVQGTHVVIRECAYTGAANGVIVQKTGLSAGVRRHITQCSSDRCNAADGSSAAIIVFAVLARLLAF